MRKNQYSENSEDYSDEKGFHKYRPMDSIIIVETREFIRHEDFHKMSKEELWLNHVGLGKNEDFYVRNDEVVDATRSWVEDFGWRDVVDMRYHASQVVVAENSNGRIHKRETEHRWKSYMYALEDVGLCHECKEPIKPTKSTYGAERRQVLKRGISCEEWRVRFDFNRYEYRDYSNLIYTDIPSHFVVKWDKKREAYYYCYEDGTKRDIRIERIPVKVRKKKGRHHWDRFHMDENGMIEKTIWKERFVQMLKDGTTVPCLPKPSYRVYHAKCECKFRKQRSKQVKARRA